MKQILLSLAVVLGSQLTAQKIYFMDFIAIPYETENNFTIDSMQLNVGGEITRIQAISQNDQLTHLIAFEPENPEIGDTTFIFYNNQNQIAGTFSSGEDSMRTELFYENDTIAYEWVHYDGEYQDSLVYAYDEQGILKSKKSYGSYDTMDITYFNDMEKITSLNHGGFAFGTLIYDEHGNLIRQEIRDDEDELLGYLEYFYTEKILTHSNSVEEDEVVIFPNPVQSGNQLQIQIAGNKNWVLYDLTGKQVASSTLETNSTISTAGFQTGVYILSVEGMQPKKILVK